MGVHRKIWFLGGGFTKKQYIWGIAKKGGGLRQFADLRNEGS